MNNLKKWMIAATADEIRSLVKQADTSRDYLYQIVGGHRTASADLAGRIETAAEALRLKSKGRLPKLTRADLAPACAECPYFRKCSKR